MKWTRILSLNLFTALILCLIAGTAVLSDTNTIKKDDIRFLQEASNSCAWKITLGDMAQKQAASSDVRRYGKLMTTDYGQYCEELKRLAHRKDVSLSINQDQPRQNTIRYLSQEYGAAFDRNYISLMMDDNQRDLSLYRTEVEKGQDSDVRAFASHIVKKLEDYIRAAEKILLDLPKPVLK